MFMDIQAVDLHLGGNPQAHQLVDHLEDDGHGHQHPHGHRSHTRQLNQQEPDAAAVEQAAVGGKQAHADSAEGTAGTVHRHRAHGIVDLGNLVKELHSQHHQDTGHQADEERAHRADHIAAGGNGHQARQGTVEGHGDVRLLIPDPGKDHGGAGGNRRGHVGVHEYQRGAEHAFVAGKTYGAGAVETEPAEPQDKHAGSQRGHVMAGNGAGLTVLGVLADTGAQHSGADAGGDAAHHMHRGAARKVMEAQAGKPTAAPDPVAGNGIDHHRNQRAVQAVGLEVGALRHRAGHDGGGGGAEHGLENHVAPQRQGAEIVAAPDQRIQPADKGARTAEHQTEAHQPVQRGTDTKVHQVFHQDVAGILGTGQACLTE